jgi:RND superfamily putative drug exporter
MDSFAEVADDLRDVGAGLDVQLGGPAAVDDAIDAQVSEDLARAESLSFPILLALLVIVFGSIVAAGLPLGVGILAVLGAFTVMRMLTWVTDVSVFSINIITLLGLGLAIDYALFVVNRFREEMHANPGRPTSGAVAATMATAGRTVAFSGITVAVSLAGLLLFPQGFLRSMAYGGIAAVMVAMVTALTVLPAVLAVLGHRVDALAIRRLLPRRIRSTRSTALVPGRTGVWERLARSVMRRPIAYSAAALGVLVLLAAPVLRIEFGGVDTRVLPAGSEPRQVEESLAADFTGAAIYPIQVLVEGAGDAAAAAFAGDVARVDGVVGVSVAATSRGATLLSVVHSGPPVDDAALDVVRAIRDLPAPGDGEAEVLVGGISAQQLDLRTSIAEKLPWMAGVIGLATFVLLFLAFGSVVLPLKAIAMNVVSVAASFGVVVWIFQDGHLADLLGFTSTGAIETTQPILMVAILFGLSMDYEVFLLSRVREEWLRTGDAAGAIAAGVQRTGRIITSAALLLVVVIGAFSTSGITFIKMIGLGMAVAIILDATLVRLILVPAIMRLLGPAAWWAPAPLRRWHERHGMTESDDVPRTPERALAGSPG